MNEFLAETLPNDPVSIAELWCIIAALAGGR